MPNTDSSEVQHMYAYPKVSELATGSENGQYYSFVPPGSVVLSSELV